jgi:Zn-finger nucleic acid-binding protein
MPIKIKRKRKDIPIPCPICGSRICDGEGVPEGSFGIELKCPKSCGYVWLDVDYLKKYLDSSKIR